MNEYNNQSYNFNPNRPLYSIDDLDMALVLSRTGDFDPRNPAHTQLLQPNPNLSSDELSEHFKDRYMSWLEEEVFQNGELDLDVDEEDLKNGINSVSEIARGWDMDLLTYATEDEKSHWDSS